MNDSLAILSSVGAYTSRVCHDLLNPVGKLEMLVDNLLNDPEHDTLNNIQDTMHQIISELNLIRRSYRLNQGLISKKELETIIENTFNQSINLQSVDINWCGNILQLITWLHYKKLPESNLSIKALGDDCVVNINDIYLDKDEIETLKGNKVAMMDAYNVYLVLFFMYVKKEADFKEIKFDIKQNDDKYDVNVFFKKRPLESNNHTEYDSLC